MPNDEFSLHDVQLDELQTGEDKTQKDGEGRSCQVGLLTTFQLETFGALATVRHWQFSDSPCHQSSVQKVPPGVFSGEYSLTVHHITTVSECC